MIIVIAITFGTFDRVADPNCFFKARLCQAVRSPEQKLALLEIWIP